MVASSERRDGVSPAESGSGFNQERSVEIVKKTSEIGFYCMGFAALGIVGAIGQLYLCRKRVWAYPVFFVEGVFATGLGIYGFVKNEIAIAEAKAPPQKKADIGSNLSAEENQPVGIMEDANYLPSLISFFQCLMNLPTLQASLKRHIDLAKEFMNAFDGFYRTSYIAPSTPDDNLHKILVVLSSDIQLVEAIQSDPELSLLAEYLRRCKEALDQNTPTPTIQTDSYQTFLANLYKIRVKKYKAHFERIKNSISQERGRFEALENASKKYQSLQDLQNQQTTKQIFQTELSWRTMKFYSPLSEFNDFLKAVVLKDSSKDLAPELLNFLLGKKYGPRTPDVFLEKTTEDESQPKREWSSYLSLNVGALEGVDDNALVRTIQRQITTAPECLILKLDRYSGENPYQNSIIMPDVFELKGSQYRKKCFIMLEPTNLNFYSAYIRKDNRWWYCCDRDVQSVSGRGECGYLYFYERSS